MAGTFLTSAALPFSSFLCRLKWQVLAEVSGSRSRVILYYCHFMYLFLLNYYYHLSYQFQLRACEGQRMYSIGLLAVFCLGDQQSGFDFPAVTCHMSIPSTSFPLHMSWLQVCMAWPRPVVKELERGTISQFHHLVDQNPDKSMDEVRAHPHNFFQWAQLIANGS